jgi:putative membrane protein
LHIKFSTTTTDKRSFANNLLLQILALAFVAIWFVLYFNCIDKKDWFIENILVFLFAIYLTAYYRTFSNASYICFFLFLLLHIFGAQYAYTKNPLGAYLQQTFQLWRNPYDRIVHFSFGLLLAYPLRDILVNKVNVRKHWQYLLPVEIILSLASTFELIEWLVSEFTTKETGETYVATQGDVWDAHKDIAVAVVGAAITMTVVYLYNRKRKIKV